METPDELRRLAAAAEEQARTISLMADREKMLATAQELRKEADELEAKLGLGGETPSPP